MSPYVGQVALRNFARWHTFAVPRGRAQARLKWALGAAIDSFALWPAFVAFNRNDCAILAWPQTGPRLLHENTCSDRGACLPLESAPATMLVALASHCTARQDSVVDLALSLGLQNNSSFVRVACLPGGKDILVCLKVWRLNRASIPLCACARI